MIAIGPASTDNFLLLLLDQQLQVNFYYYCYILDQQLQVNYYYYCYWTNSYR